MTQRNRRILIYGIPLFAALIIAVLWAYSGRYIATDNAYVKATQTHISPEVSGLIAEVMVRENQKINAGDELFRIHSSTFVAAIEGLEAALESIRIEVETQRAAYLLKKEELILAEENLHFATSEHERQSRLAQKGMNSESQLDRSAHERQVARQTIKVIKEDLKRLLAALQGNPDLVTEQHPRYLTALAELRQAQLDLEHTHVLSPLSGVAAKTPNAGQYVETGKAVMTVVSSGKRWVEANYMETQLTKVVPGMPATIKIDTYPNHEWRGKVESISPATGAEYAILPPQNATGNWVKITQRIPVRISIEPREGDPLLVKGMTAEVEIDTGTYH
ncbi:MAG: HlyD family secretion protein [Porticoccaceae bacterium]|nr:HlyD family secretion protein [Porticoccaceae bacterium]